MKERYKEECNMQRKSLNKKVLSEQIKEELMESILSGELPPGQKLVENSLAQAFKVSQAPVREALKSLEALGLVSVEAYKGTTVKKFGRNEMHEYFIVRTALEGMAGRYAAENITEEEIKELEGLLDDMIQATKDGDYERRTEINQVFHQVIIEASKNSLLVNVCKTIRLGSWSRITSKHTNMDEEELATRHKEMVELLKKRDGMGMEKAIKKHIEASFKNFNKVFYVDNEE